MPTACTRSAQACPCLPSVVERTDTVSCEVQDVIASAGFSVAFGGAYKPRKCCSRLPLQLWVRRFARPFLCRNVHHDACPPQCASVSPRVRSLSAGSSGDKASTPAVSPNVADRRSRTARARQKKADAPRWSALYGKTSNCFSLSAWRSAAERQASNLMLDLHVPSSQKRMQKPCRTTKTYRCMCHILLFRHLVQWSFTLFTNICGHMRVLALCLNVVCTTKTSRT